MPDSEKQIVVFVHGWSVTHTNTYGGLPQRLQKEAKAAGLDIAVREIFLGKYVSFRDEVRVEDIARGFRAAVERELTPLLESGRRFTCITHSTGGPVIRDWWHRYYHTRARSGVCPMSHLIMLAPANFGSALAQLGKARISRIKAWFQGVEPGTGVLDWLELGSPESWALGEAWTRTDNDVIGPRGIFPFVLTGQSIDRKLYDHLNSYTGEIGSDGVVRVASANLNARCVVLTQEAPRPADAGGFEAPALKLGRAHVAPETAMRIVSGASHSGLKMGIMRSVDRKRGASKGSEVVDCILRCLQVRTRNQYDELRGQFDKENKDVQQAEQVERETRILRDAWFVHDRFSMVIFRLTDDHGYPVTEADMLLTAGEQHDPNMLPQGFFADRQKNRRHGGTLTYFFNHDVMIGCDEVWHVTKKGKEKLIREEQPGAERLGLKITPRPATGFVHYLPCDLEASGSALRSFLKPNQTTLVDIVLRRVVHEGVFRLDRGTKQRKFKNDPPGPPLEQD